MAGETLLTSGSNAGTANNMSQMAPIFMGLGAIQSMVGTYYGAKTQQYQLDSQKLTYEFQQDMSEINARQMERQAQSIMLAGQRQQGQIGLRAGKVKGATRASQAARGITMGVGSAAEEIATIDLVKEIDMLTINVNTTQAANAARTQGVNFSNQSLMQGVSASNAGAGASTIDPYGQAATSLIGSASAVSANWYQSNRLSKIEALLAAGKGA